MAIPLPFNLPKGSILSAANDNILSTNAMKMRVQEQMQRRSANMPSISQYEPSPYEMDRFNRQKSQLLQEGQQPLNRAAGSQLAANFMENLVKPALEIEGIGILGGLAKKGGKALTKKMAEMQAAKMAAMGGADETAIAGFTMKDGKQTFYNINGDELGSIERQFSKEVPTPMALRSKLPYQNVGYKPPIKGKGAPFLTEE
jgi:hypothetical protein